MNNIADVAELASKWDSMLSVLVPVLLAWFMVKEIKRSPTTDKESEKIIIKVVERFAGVLLIPFIMSIVAKAAITESSLPIFIVGFVLPILVYLVLFLMVKLPWMANLFTTDWPIASLLMSTFGGGNRGNLLLITAFGTQTQFGLEVIKNFVILDLGNLFCLLAIGFPMVGKVGKQEVPIKQGESWLSVLWHPGLYAFIIPLAQSLLPVQLSGYGLVDAISPHVSPFFSLFVFISIFMRLDTDNLTKTVKENRDILIYFLISRVIVIISISGILLATVYADLALLFAITVLTLMPPSNFLWIRITEILEPSKLITNCFLAPNFVYLTMLTIAFCYGLAVAFL